MSYGLKINLDFIGLLSDFLIQIINDLYRIVKDCNEYIGLNILG